jgi:hypothetical protein
MADPEQKAEATPKSTVSYYNSPQPLFIGQTSNDSDEGTTVAIVIVAILCVLALLEILGVFDMKTGMYNTYGKLNMFYKIALWVCTVLIVGSAGYRVFG